MKPRQRPPYHSGPTRPPRFTSTEKRELSRLLREAHQPPSDKKRPLIPAPKPAFALPRTPPKTIPAPPKKAPKKIPAKTLPVQQKQPPLKRIIHPERANHTLIALLTAKRGEWAPVTTLAHELRRELQLPPRGEFRTLTANAIKYLIAHGKIERKGAHGSASRWYRIKAGP